ncbi:MAG: CHRD domain-containing protein [Rubrobacteraceae bacterium]
MRSRRLLAAAVLATLGALLYAGPATAQTFDADATGLALPTVNTTELTGAAEVPGPGDADGSGTATVITVPSHTICYVLTATDIAPAQAAHIHEGTADMAGPVVTELAPPTLGVSGGCTTADPTLVSELAAEPSDYYVNVHNEPYPDGAIRGQLAD